MSQNLLLYIKKLMGIYRWEYVKVCPFCSGGEFELFSKCYQGLLKIQLQSCKHCRLIFQSPRLTKDSLDKFYQNEYSFHLKKRAYIRRCEEMFERGLRRGTNICKFLEDNGINYRGSFVFEIGCAYGGILEQFRRRGCRVKGCDLRMIPVRYGISRGLDLTAGSIDAFTDQDHKADLMILSHLLEHILDPYPFLKKVRQILKPGGVLYVEVPGIGNPKAKRKRYAKISHLIYFNKGTLAKVVEKAGFSFICGNEIVQGAFSKD